MAKDDKRRIEAAKKKRVRAIAMQSTKKDVRNY
jgi:hypothetical protein